MKSKSVTEPRIRIAVLESDPLRVVGFRSLFESEPEFELIPVSLAALERLQRINVVLTGVQPGKDLLAGLDGVRAVRPDLPMIVTAPVMNDETMLKVVAAGGRGCIAESADQAEFVRAVRVVSEGGTWVPRRVLLMIIQRSSGSSGRSLAGRTLFTGREKQVLQMLVEGRSNKEIAGPLGIEERTVKSHVAKLMRKVGVQNRIALSVHAIKHSLLTTEAETIQ